MRYLRDIRIDLALAVATAAGICTALLTTGCSATEVEYQILVDREFAVQPVLETSIFRSGDKFRLRLTPRQDCHVYLLNRGTSGNYTVLFPKSQINTGSNFVPAGVCVMIPAEGSYQFDERTGFEEVILCACRRPYPPLDQLAWAGFRDAASVDSLLVKLEQANRENSSLVKTLDKDRTRVCLVAGQSAAVLVSRIILRHEPAAAPLKPASDPRPVQSLTSPEPPVTSVDRSDSPAQRTNWTLSDAVQQGLVEVHSSGIGLSAVRLRVRRLHAQGFRVDIPPGTYFASTSSTQNMVTTAPQWLDLNNQERIELELPAVCANFHRPQPGAGSRFRVSRLENRTLQRLLEVIARRSVPQTVAQVAVWVVTDDVSRSELDRGYRATHYVNGFRTGEGPAASDEQIAEARKLLEEAGVDTSRACLFR